MAIGKFLKFVAYVACKLRLAPSESCLTMFAYHFQAPIVSMPSMLHFRAKYRMQMGGTEGKN